ncbi:MAG: hypothetical protein WC681_02545 [Sterolibacterium sp.]|jgi:hypothetical protein
MTSTITHLYNSLPNKDKPALIVQETVTYFQDEVFFRLAFEKEKRVSRLIEHFRGKPVQRVLFCDHFRNLAVDSPSMQVGVLDEDFFSLQDAADEDRKAAYLSGALVIVNNTEAGHRLDGYVRLFNRCVNTIFVMWDWDNHHWMSASAVLAVHSDLYVPTHRENLYALSRFNSVITEPVAALSVQWSRKFLAQHHDLMQTRSRSSEPLGLHVMYPGFVYRNRVISTLNQKVPSIGFSTQQFHSRTAADRLEEWCGHKSHWIVPVLNDVPTRMFDALISGGIPIVPEALRFFEPIREIDRRHILFYGPADIVAPDAIATKASAMFDQGGREKIMERHRYALANLHGDKSIERILAYAMEKFEIVP